MDMVDFKVRLRLIKGEARQGGKAWLGALTSCRARDLRTSLRFTCFFFLSSLIIDKFIVRHPSHLHSFDHSGFVLCLQYI